MPETERQAWIDEQMMRHFMNASILESSVWTIGTLALNATSCSVLMWAHYTVQHTGFVIGIDTAHDAWTAVQKRLGRPGEPRSVTYEKTRPKRGSVGDVSAENAWYTKSDEWILRRGVGFTRLLRTASKVLGSHNDTVHLFELPKESVRKVIVAAGPKIS